MRWWHFGSSKMRWIFSLPEEMSVLFRAVDLSVPYRSDITQQKSCNPGILFLNSANKTCLFTKYWVKIRKKTSWITAAPRPLLWDARQHDENTELETTWRPWRGRFQNLSVQSEKNENRISRLLVLSCTLTVHSTKRKWAAVFGYEVHHINPFSWSKTKHSMQQSSV